MTESLQLQKWPKHNTAQYCDKCKEKLRISKLINFRSEQQLGFAFRPAGKLIGNTFKTHLDLKHTSKDFVTMLFACIKTS